MTKEDLAQPVNPNPRKQKYIDALVKAHPVYTPDNYITQQAIKRLDRLPEQTLFWLYHELPPKPSPAKTPEEIKKANADRLEKALKRVKPVDILYMLTLLKKEMYAVQEGLDQMVRLWHFYDVSPDDLMDFGPLTPCSLDDLVIRYGDKHIEVQDLINAVETAIDKAD